MDQQVPVSPDSAIGVKDILSVADLLSHCEDFLKSVIKHGFSVHEGSHTPKQFSFVVIQNCLHCAERHFSSWQVEAVLDITIDAVQIAEVVSVKHDVLRIINP